MSRRGVLLFVAMGVIWGLPYLLIKVSIRDVPPAALVFARTAVGSILLVPVAARRGDLGPALRRWRPLVAYTVAEVTVPWLLLPRAEERLSSSLSGLLVAAVPLVGVLVARTDPGRERLGRRRLAGLAVGLVGVGVLVGFDVSGADVGAVALVGVVVVGYAVGPAIVVRSLAGVPSLGVVALSLLLTAAVYAGPGLAEWPGHVGARPLAAVVVLGVVCTAVAFVAYFALIAEAGPVRATIITYLNPAVAVALGVAFLHEAFTAATAIGFVLVLSGSVLAARRRPAARAQPAPT